MRCSRPDSTMTSWPVIPRETEPRATKRGMSEAGRKTLEWRKGGGEAGGREREEGRRSRGRFSPLPQTNARLLQRRRNKTRHVQGNGVVLDEADVEPMRSVEDDVGT